MGGGDTPPPPDYAAANREAILTDIETLPLRKQVDYGSKAGKGGVGGGKYWKSDAEYNAQMDNLRTELATVGAGSQRGREIQAELDKYSDYSSFEGMGDREVALAQASALLDTNDEAARRQLALRQELGVDTVLQTIEELKAADPEGYQARKDLQAKLIENLNSGDSAQVDPRLAAALEDVAGEYALGSTLDAGTRKEVEQGMRSGQAARGNILGNAAAAAEAMEIGTAGENRKQQRLSNLVNLATQVDNTKYARDQQNMSNVSNFVLGNPITNQFASLQGAQQGAVAYNPINYSTTGQNPNAGAQGTQFALGNYGNVWDSSQAGVNPWMATLGGAATGAAAGFAVGGPWGAAAGGVLGAGAGYFGSKT